MEKVVSHEKQILQGKQKTVLILLNEKLYLQNSYKTSILALQNVFKVSYYIFVNNIIIVYKGDSKMHDISCP